MKPRGKKKTRRYVLLALAGLYLITWVWGVPAVSTDIAKDVITQYKQASRKSPAEVWEAHPHLRFGASYAIFPLVTVSHYEYQVARLWGWSGFTVDIWYFKGRVTICRFTKWVS
jgi:hypothetical protein